MSSEWSLFFYSQELKENKPHRLYSCNEQKFPALCYSSSCWCHLWVSELYYMLSQVTYIPPEVRSNDTAIEEKFKTNVRLKKKWKWQMLQDNL